jgi:hypothetical protein
MSILSDGCALVLSALVSWSAALLSAPAAALADGVTARTRRPEVAARLQRWHDRHPGMFAKILSSSKELKRDRVGGLARWYGPTEGSPITNAGFRARLRSGKRVILRPVRDPQRGIEIGRAAEPFGGPRILGSARLHFAGDQGNAVVAETVSNLIAPSGWRALRLERDELAIIRHALIAIAEQLPSRWTALVGLQSSEQGQRYRVRFRNSTQWGEEQQNREAAAFAVDAQLAAWGSPDAGERSGRAYGNVAE